MIACACSRFDLIVGSAEADPTASSSPAASAAKSTIFGVTRSSSPHNGLLVDSEQTRRWRSGPSQVAEPSSAHGRLQTRAAPKSAAKLRLVRSLPGHRVIDSVCRRPSCSGRTTWVPIFAAVLVGALVAGSAAARADSSRTPYRLQVDAVAYHLPGRTALGIPVRKGVVAVDPQLIPLGTRLHVPGYGRAIARPTSGRRSRAASSTSGSRARRPPGSGAGGRCTSPSTASSPSSVGALRYTGGRCCAS